MNERTPVPSEAEATAQTQMRQIVAELEAIQFRLQGIQASLPVPPREAAMLAGEMEMDFATEVRSVIDCVLNDSIRPAIRDLVKAAACQFEPEKT